MNRITAVLLAMIALLVHALVIHRDAGGLFAPPFDSAHVAYVLGRNLAQHGEVSWWAPAGGASDLSSYPSPLLVWLSAGLHLVGANVDRAAQLLGTVVVLFTVFLSTRFDTDRIAGVIPALLLVTSGAVASAGASGSEWPFAMFALTLSFVALEHGHSRFATVGLALLVVTRPEGIVAAAALFVMTLMRKARQRQTGERGGLPSLLTFVPAALLLGVAHVWSGTHLLGDTRRLLLFETPDFQHGAAQLRDFTLGAATPVLLLFPLVTLIRGGLSMVGFRALLLTVVWTVSVLGAGGGPAPFCIAFAPVLPISFIAIQQGMARVLDTYRRSMEQLVWVALGAGMIGSIFASRFPGNFGRIELLELQEATYTAEAEVPLGGSPLIGRSAQFAEIRLVRDLRRVGAFLDGRLVGDVRVMTPWPGVLGWKMNAHVLDMFGRIERRGGEPTRNWYPEPGDIDLRAALAQEPDYIIPAIRALDNYVAGRLPALIPERFFELDPTDDVDLRRDVGASLARYEVLVTTGRNVPSKAPARPLMLLGRRDLKAPIEMTGRREGGQVLIEASFKGALSDRENGLPQVFDLRLIGVYDDGSRETLDPLGRAIPRLQDAAALSASGLVIDPLSDVPVTLAQVPLEPEGAAPKRRLVRLDARLLHHLLDPADPRADATSPLLAPVR